MLVNDIARPVQPKGRVIRIGEKRGARSHATQVDSANEIGHCETSLQFSVEIAALVFRKVLEEPDFGLRIVNWRGVQPLANCVKRR